MLRAFERLEVGPIRLEPRRLVAPYTVHADASSESTELAYRWETDVFDPSDRADRNLAALIAAQVALNYGLFCDELVFHGPLDATDRRFLQEMAANTAREIYVKKFLQPNPFLLGPAAELPAVRRSSYLRAELRFPTVEETSEHGAAKPRARGRSASRASWPAAGRGSGAPHAVLASGGKDSLLTLGLLEEAGLEVHSLFVNESGRHWYTALNAYRHLSETRPRTTARIWTSADRVFGWMLRRLPFVREDYARVRSDEYPIRLWTVAVFLFGALPLARRRGISRLLVGDEYDTTRRVRHEGIPHYDGLYDQSRWFDEALTRFYRRKRWPLVQFSVLRPCSELLIQKTLAERYPELQAYQVSCHAASLEGERARPCGRCEKCRRVVGMLTAIGADPGACGYRPEAVERCLAALPEKGVHQETPTAQHLGWLLRQRGILPATQGRRAGKRHGLVSRGLGDEPARERPEVMKLRFHPEASPLDAIPADLRRPAWAPLLEHGEGAVRRRGRVWVPFDPLAPAALARPYRFERGRGSARVRAPQEQAEPPRPGREPDKQEAGRRGEQHLLAYMTWPQAERRLRETDTALLPVGALEQHGPHLPLDTDAWDADYLCRCVAERCSHPRPLVLPLLPYGVSYHHADFPGTLSISGETLVRLVYEVGMSAARHGITKLVIVNGHGGNAPALQYAAQMINRDAHIFTCVDTGETSDADVAEVVETPEDLHAGEIETSTALATRPELVDREAAETHVPRFPSQYLQAASGRGVPWFAHTGRISPSGVLGDPGPASREKGEAIWELMISHLTAFVEALKGMTLAEIHEKEL